MDLPQSSQLFVGLDREAAGTQRTPIYVQYGCGSSCPDGWLNFDASPNLRLARLPVVGRAISRLAGAFQFPNAARYGCIVEGLPVDAGSADGVYASHVLEHLSLTDARAALRNTFAMLRRGGVFRLIVPDLRARAEAYLSSEDPDAASTFVRDIGMGVEASHSSRGERLRSAFGNGRHLWMWDHPSMEGELKAAGFVNIAPAEIGDSGDPMFDLVEDPERFCYGGIREIAIHAVKP